MDFRMIWKFWIGLIGLKTIKRNGVIVENVIPMVLSELEVQDIDNESDWTLAEIKYKMMNNTRH